MTKNLHPIFRDFLIAIFLTTIAIMIGASLAACGTIPKPADVEMSNAMANARACRQASPTLEGYEIVEGDAQTATTNCSHGSWASVNFVSPDKVQTFKLKCSTASSTPSCLTSTDFNALVCKG